MLDQFDLFNTDANNTELTQFHTEPEFHRDPECPVGFRQPISEKPKQEPLYSGEKCLWHFATKEAVRLWPSLEHRKRSLNQLERFLRFEGNDKTPITEFTEDHVHEFLDHIAQSQTIIHKGAKRIIKGASESTQNRYAATLSKVFRTAKHRLDIHFHAENVMARPRYFTPEELAAIKDFFVERGDQWMADMVHVGSITGMRKTEIVKVALGIIPLSPCGKHAIIEPENSKNGFERSVPINAVLDEINRLRIALKGMYSHRSFYRRWALCKRELAPRDPNFVFHCTRHSAATLMTNSVKLPTVTVQKWLGHKDPRTTAKYVSTIDKAMEEATDNLAKAVQNR